MSKKTKALSAVLAKLLGMEVEVVDMNNVDEDASPEARKLVEEAKAREKNNRLAIAKMSGEFLNMLSQDCCTNPDHRRIPLNDSDVLAINNAMGCMMEHLHDAMNEHTHRMYSIIHWFMRNQKMGELPELIKADLKGLENEVAAAYSIIAAHFDLVTRPGKIGYLNHYVKIGAMIEAWSEGKETSCETGRTH